MGLYVSCTRNISTAFPPGLLSFSPPIFTVQQQLYIQPPTCQADTLIGLISDGEEDNWRLLAGLLSGHCGVLPVPELHHHPGDQVGDEHQRHHLQSSAEDGFPVAAKEIFSFILPLLSQS